MNILVSKKLIKLLKKDQQEIINFWFDSQFNVNILRKYKIQNISNSDVPIIKEIFLIPLLDLLIEYLKNKDKVYLYLYLDERLRYINGIDLKLQKEYLSETLNKECSFFQQRLGLTHKSRIEFQKFWDDIHKFLLRVVNKKPIYLLAIGDCFISEIKIFLNKACHKSGIDLIIRHLYFSASLKVDFSPNSVLSYIKDNKPDIIAISFLTYRGLPFYSTLMDQIKHLSNEEIKNLIYNINKFIQSFIIKIREITDIPLLIHNTCGIHVEYGISNNHNIILNLLNQEINKIVNSTKNTFLINEQAILKKFGYRVCCKKVLKNYKKKSYFHTSFFGNYLADVYKDIIISYKKLHKIKVILVDFDNTLWDGVMADGTVIQRKGIQELLKRIKSAGILLVAISKNDPKNIRWEEMILQKMDFVIMKINWRPKIENIREVYEELNLGLETFIFIDDNPVECEIIKNSMPLVQTLDANDPETWKSIERMLQFPNTNNTEEAKKRTEIYQSRMKRRKILEKIQDDYPSMMKMLNLKVRFGLAKKKNLDRITELVTRTNQFNTTTIRYSRSDLQNLMKSKSHKIYIFELSDKFGDSGIIGSIIIKKKEDKLIFESIIMSCRAMGFGLEQLMLKLVLKEEQNGTKQS